MNDNDKPTQPPTEADEGAAQFEHLIETLGEGQARWLRLVDLLEGES